MTEQEFITFYGTMQQPLLKQALHRTNDLFLAEEAVNDSLLKAWAADIAPSFAQLNLWTTRAIIDGWRRVHGKAGDRVEVLLSTPIVDQAEGSGEITIGEQLECGYDFEERVLNLILLREIMRTQPQQQLQAVFNPKMPEDLRKARLHRLRTSVRRLVEVAC